METKLLFGIISAILIAVPFVIYIHSIIVGETKPHIYTRFLYFIITLIIFLVQLKNGGAYGSIYLFIMTVFSLITYLLSFKYGTSDITHSDRFFLILGLLSIPLWFFTENALYSVILLTFVDLLATIPTIRKTIVDPDSENRYFYIIEIVGLVFALFSLGDFSLVNVIYPVFLLIINIVILLVVLIGRKKLFLV